MRPYDLATLYRMLLRTELVTFTGCWLWTGATAGGNRPGSNPYGRVWYEGHGEYVHILGPRLLVGVEVPKGWHMDHHLDCNTLCWNPDHVRPVPASENCRRAAERTNAARCCA